MDPFFLCLLFRQKVYGVGRTMDRQVLKSSTPIAAAEPKAPTIDAAPQAPDRPAGARRTGGGHRGEISKKGKRT